jgi:hypothetical protein
MELLEYLCPLFRDLTFLFWGSKHNVHLIGLKLVARIVRGWEELCLPHILKSVLPPSHFIRAILIR